MKKHVKNLMQINAKNERKRRFRLVVFCWICLFILYRGIFSIILISSNIDVTAHRGSCNLAPENTIASVVEAITLDSAYVEVDVQLSRDGQVFLLHDSSFDRVAGLKVRSWELDYEDICAINVGAYKMDGITFSAPLLDDVIKVCSISQTKLNIELKNYGHSQTLPNEVVRIIKENDFVDRCVVTSSSLEMLKKVRVLEPRIKIGLITSSTSITTYIKNRFVDFYSINYVALSPTIVMYAHALHKEVYCWTVNNNVSIAYAFHAGVDNIITDNVKKVQFYIVSH